MPLTRTAAAALALLGAGCISNLFGDPPAGDGAGCARDADCPAGQSCWIDGCGALGDDLVAEVTWVAPPGVATVELPLGHPSADRRLTVPAAQGVLLHVRRDGAAYAGPVRVVASGTSARLPGVARRAEAAGASASGALPVALSTGTYTLVLSPGHPALPPTVRRGLVVDAGLGDLVVDLAPAGAVQTARGVVLAAPGRPEPTRPSVRLLDTDGVPLADDVVTDAAGAFQLAFATGALDTGTARLLVVPPAPDGLRATKAFPVPDATRFAQPFVVGDVDAPVPVAGVVVGPDGAPVAGAAVFVEGDVVGGGSVRTAAVQTDGDGGFRLSTLPAADAGTLRLWAIPPPGSAAGLLRAELPGGAPPASTWACPARSLVQGTVLAPDGGPVRAAAVRLEPVGPSAADVPQPPAGDATETDPAGRFALRVDPALHRLEIRGPPSLPTLRTYVRIPAAGPVLDGGRLPAGRHFTATVTSPSGAPVPQALVRISRSVRLDDGSERALALGEAVTDVTGKVSILLPVVGP